MSTSSPVKDQEKLRELKSLWIKTSKKYVLIDFMLNTGLRVSDVLSTKVGTVLHGEYIGIEQKTKKPKRFKLNAGIQLIIRDYVLANNLAEDDYLFPSNKNPEQHISRYQAFRIIQESGDLIGLKLSPHSLRKTFGYLHYKRTNDVSLLMKVFNHSSPAVTLSYIGLDEETMQNEIYNHYIWFLEQ